MKVCIVDVDSKIPNVALMKLSAWHKSNGDDVVLGWDGKSEFDLCYASKIFDFTPDKPLPPCEVVKGGPAYSLSAKLPEGVESMMPDYSLYGWYGKRTYSMGRFTRGCPNNCPWCIVPKMDGNELTWVHDLSDFHDPRHGSVRVMDDNIMVDEDMFDRACGQLRDAGVKAIWEALDIRRVNDRTAAALASVKHEKRIHFSWDGRHQDRFIEPAIECLRQHGLKPWRFMFYVLVGFNTDMEYDLHRIMTLKELGADPFVMPFDKHDRRQKDLARWCNNKFIFRTTEWEDYDCPTNREVDEG